MYAVDNDLVFEIVGISVDSTMEDWEGGLEDNDLPWINLGEIEGWNGAVAVSYGVNFIPKGFLIDSEVCITQKIFRPINLNRYYPVATFLCRQNPPILPRYKH